MMAGEEGGLDSNAGHPPPPAPSRPAAPALAAPRPRPAELQSARPLCHRPRRRPRPPRPSTQRPSWRRYSDLRHGEGRRPLATPAGGDADSGHRPGATGAASAATWKGATRATALAWRDAGDGGRRSAGFCLGRERRGMKLGAMRTNGTNGSARGAATPDTAPPSPILVAPPSDPGLLTFLSQIHRPFFLPAPSVLPPSGATLPTSYNLSGATLPHVLTPTSTGAAVGNPLPSSPFSILCWRTSFFEKQTMKVKDMSTSTPTDVICEEAVLTSYHRCDDKGKDRSWTHPVEYPLDSSFHSIDLEKFDLQEQELEELISRRYSLIAESLPNDIIIPDPTPKWVQDRFYEISPCLESILKKDSVRCFLRMFAESSWSMAWNYSITSETLIYMIKHDALRCARVVLEGKAPQLRCMHANPNCMNPYGYFPLHGAAERFSVDMIKLLFRYGASANVRTSGNIVIEGLLPLHVAVGNTCLHKYLEDTLFPTKDHQDYVYRLIYLLCLPEMKVFLDTTRLLAAKTNNLVDEVWNYMKSGKLVEATVLLLAAQREIRKACTPKGNVKHNGFYMIMYRLYDYSLSLRCAKDHSGAAQIQLKEKRTLIDCAWLVVRIIAHAGEALDKYIQAHSEVPQREVLEHVSSILKEYGFCPKGECIDVTNFCSYDCNISYGKLDDKGHVDGTNASTKAFFYAHDAVKTAVRKKTPLGPLGWDPTHATRSYFPNRRSVLWAPYNVRMCPSAAADQHRGYWSSSIGRGSSSFQSRTSLSGRIQQATNDYQSRRFLCTVASTLLKKLKIA